MDLAENVLIYQQNEKETSDRSGRAQYYVREVVLNPRGHSPSLPGRVRIAERRRYYTPRTGEPDTVRTNTVELSRSELKEILDLMSEEDE